MRVQRPTKMGAGQWVVFFLPPIMAIVLGTTPKAAVAQQDEVVAVGK
jgi:hypothetical protein